MTLRFIERKLRDRCQEHALSARLSLWLWRVCAVARGAVPARQGDEVGGACGRRRLYLLLAASLADPGRPL